jgi:excisionase family DNA binding protein
MGSKTAWTAEAIHNLGMTTDIETAGAILGIGRSKSYELAKDGEFPVKVLRIGRRYLVPIPALMALLEADADGAT